MRNPYVWVKDFLISHCEKHPFLPVDGGLIFWGMKTWIIGFEVWGSSEVLGFRYWGRGFFWQFRKGWSPGSHLSA